MYRGGAGVRPSIASSAALSILHIPHIVRTPVRLDVVRNMYVSVSCATRGGASGCDGRRGAGRGSLVSA